MTDLVVDASVAIKWFVPEVSSPAAVLFLEGDHELVAPDLLLPEAGNILWKKVQREELTAETAGEILKELLHVPVRIEPSEPLVGAALELALRTRTTVYDCMYVVLSSLLDCELVTADRRLFERHRRGPLARHLRWVESV